MSTQGGQRSTLASRLVAAIAADPGRIAVRDERDHLTFGDLGEVAGGVAAALAAADPDGRAPVPVVGHRDVTTVAAIAGVILAGRAWATIDATDPPPRIATIAERLGADVAVIGRGVAPDGVPGRAIAVDDPGLPPPIGPVADPDPGEVGAVIFTSGSTGIPKGVVYDHLRLEARADRRLRPKAVAESGPVVPLSAPLSYAAGFGRLFDLLAGRTLAIFDPAGRGPLRYAEWLDAERFARISMVPSLARAILSQWPSGRRLESVVRISTHGEGLHWADVGPLRDLIAEGGTVRSTYAASEATGALEFEIGPDDPLGTGAVPLGRPGEDRDVRLVPVTDDPGAPGEIMIVDDAVALGYWGDPERTAARFGQLEDGRRCYRTGDLAEIDDDGVFHHRGRSDDMVKIRGLLVEPAESERLLRAMPGVRTATVLPHPLPEGGHRLVAHVVPDPSGGLTPESVRADLAAQLPAHVVPSVIARYDALPLTPRGKVDRQALLGAPVEAWRTTPLEAPLGVRETTVASIVSTLLGLDRVGRHDDLFELGLDSLAAQELVAVVEDRFGVALPVTALLDAPTVARLAPLTLDRTPRSALSVRFNPDARSAPLFCVSGAGGTALKLRPLADRLTDRPVVVIEANGLHRRGRPDRTIEAMARRAEREIRRHQAAGPYLLMGHSVGGLVAFEVARRLRRRGEQIGFLAVLDVAPGVAAATPELGASIQKAMGRADVPTAVALLAGIQRRASRWWRSAAAGFRPVRDIRGYDVFVGIGTRAASRYSPEPLDVDLLVVAVADRHLAQHWAGLVPDVASVHVSGDHNSMLLEPHVAELAAVLGARLPAPDVSPVAAADTVVPGGELTST
jgi:acyl-CoA synthetase (AMP-forming)/AMP-acid ligase II/thioesterase domain-containing protein/acyl carrier protein